MDRLEMGKEIKIKSVKKIWKQIEKGSLPIELDFSQLEKFDAAGFQLMLYLLKLRKEEPESYIIKGLKESLLTSLPAYGYNLNEGEHK